MENMSPAQKSCAQKEIYKLIDNHAIVDPGASIAPDVEIGPFTIIDKDVEIGKGSWVGPHVTINGPVKIGQDCKIFQYSSIGEAPQDKTYANEPTRLEIGDRNIIREFCAIHRGTVGGGGVTHIGNDNFIMAYVHIAHDSFVGNNTMFVNGASLAGHAIVEDFTILSGFTLVHQFVSIGAHCYCTMGSGIARDVPPYMMVSGNFAKPRGINTEGLKRRGFEPDVIRDLRKAYKILYKSKLTLEQAIDELNELSAECKEVGHLAEFIKNSRRGIVR